MSYEGAKIGRRSNLVKRELAMIKTEKTEATVSLLIDNPPAKRMRQQFVSDQSQDVVSHARPGYDFNSFSMGYHGAMHAQGPMFSGFGYVGDGGGGGGGLNWGFGGVHAVTNTSRVTSMYHQASGHWMPSSIQYY